MTDEIKRREGVQRAPTVPDTGRPSQASPWVDAPTHDGLWWVRDESAGASFVVDVVGQRITGCMGWSKSSAWSQTSPWPPSWKFTPAVPPAHPTVAT